MKFNFQVAKQTQFCFKLLIISLISVYIIIYKQQMRGRDNNDYSKTNNQYGHNYSNTANNHKPPLYSSKPGNGLQLNKKLSSDSDDMVSLKAQYDRLKQQIKNKQDELTKINAKCRQEGIRNQKLKKQVSDADEHTKMFVWKQAQILTNKYKNTDSPLFKNQNGLSPFQLLKLGQQKFTGQQDIICMVCFMDMKKGQRILCLPCQHVVHKQCGIQNLLYSKVCPACSQPLK